MCVSILGARRGKRKRRACTYATVDVVPDPVRRSVKSPAMRFSALSLCAPIPDAKTYSCMPKAAPKTVNNMVVLLRRTALQSTVSHGRVEGLGEGRRACRRCRETATTVSRTPGRTRALIDVRQPLRRYGRGVKELGRAGRVSRCWRRLCRVEVPGERIRKPGHGDRGGADWLRNGCGSDSTTTIRRRRSPSPTKAIDLATLSWGKNTH